MSNLDQDLGADLESGPSSESGVQSTAELNTSTVTSGGAPVNPPWVTSDNVASASTALVIVAAVAVVSVVIDILTYMAYCSVKQGNFSTQELQAFAYFPAIGASAVGVCVWLLLNVFGLSSDLLNDRRVCGVDNFTLFLWFMLIAGSVANVGLGFIINDNVFGKPYDHSQSMDWLVSMALNVGADIVLGLPFLFGASQPIVKFLFRMDEIIKGSLDPFIGPGTSFAEGDYAGCLSHCCSSLWTRSARVSDVSEADNAVSAPLLGAGHS